LSAPAAGDGSLCAETFLLARRLAGGLGGDDACVECRARRGEEGSGGGGGVPDASATARIWRTRRRPDGGSGGGRWNGIGRGRRGAGGRVHRRNYAGGCAEERIGLWGDDAWEGSFLVGFLPARLE
jgi:hypothetical protein